MPNTGPSQPVDFGMTDIEEALRGPQGPSVRQELLERLDRLTGEFSEKLRLGLPPTDYARAQAIANALAAAREVVVAFKYQ
jgi:hypothetical protein